MASPEYRVYVIEIKGRWRSLFGVDLTDDKCVYCVGQTGKSIEARFADHLTGERRLLAAKCFADIRKAKQSPLTKHDIVLRRSVFGSLPKAASRDEAIALEQRTIGQLRASGHVVLGS